MSPDREEHDMVCQKAVTLLVDLCLHNSTLLDPDTCQDFLFLLSSQGSDHKDPALSRSRPFKVLILARDLHDSKAEKYLVLKDCSGDELLIFLSFLTSDFTGSSAEDPGKCRCCARPAVSVECLSETLLLFSHVSQRSSRQQGVTCFICSPVAEGSENGSTAPQSGSTERLHRAAPQSAPQSGSTERLHRAVPQSDTGAGEAAVCAAGVGTNHLSPAASHGTRAPSMRSVWMETEERSAFSSFDTFSPEVSAQLTMMDFFFFLRILSTRFLQPKPPLWRFRPESEERTCQSERAALHSKRKQKHSQRTAHTAGRRSAEVSGLCLTPSGEDVSSPRPIKQVVKLQHGPPEFTRCSTKASRGRCGSDRHDILPGGQISEAPPASSFAAPRSIEPQENRFCEFTGSPRMLSPVPAGTMQGAELTACGFVACGGLCVLLFRPWSQRTLSLDPAPRRPPGVISSGLQLRVQCHYLLGSDRQTDAVREQLLNAAEQLAAK
ncbi:unnamed protein product [Pleuronectes platessa]|uniref:Uncharacterized protein n=1 Tax=Pleuronectes platessa TaxID=8262 RepID=A0A9N7Z9R7_PLEPL|nr:unnamed protein product [Pleuronectes platessa]